MKKVLIAVLLSFTLVGCGDSKQIPDTDLPVVEVQEVTENYLRVTPIKNTVFQEEFLLLVGENTQWNDITLEDVKVGDYLVVELDDIMMPSLPPQINAKKIWKQ